MFVFYKAVLLCSFSFVFRFLVLAFILLVSYTCILYSALVLHFILYYFSFSYVVIVLQ